MILTWHLAVMTSCGSTTPKSLTVDQQQSTTTWSTLANAVVILSGRLHCASCPHLAEVSPVGLRLSRAVLPAGLVLIGAGDPGPAAGLHHRRSTVAHHRHRSVSPVLVEIGRASCRDRGAIGEAGGVRETNVNSTTAK